MTNLVAAVVIIVLGLIPESITSWRAIRGARKHFPELWAHSGKPTLMGNGDLIKAWPLIKYYRDRFYLQDVHRDEVTLSGITDEGVLAFAESVRAPFIYTYYLAVICLPLASLILIVAPF